MKPTKKTKHLFYDKYVNKIAIYSPLAGDFREKNLVKLRERLNHYDKLLENNKFKTLELGTWNKRKISVDDLFSVIKLLTILEKEENFSVRVEGRILSIYSNNDAVIEEIRKIRPGNVREITVPENQTIKDFLLANPNKIISKNYTHKYRITVNPLKDQAKSFHDWAEKLPKIKLLKRTYHSEGYFYAADEKVLGLCKIFLGGRIRRIDEMISEEEIYG